MYVDIAVPKETQAHERLVALVASVMSKLVKLGAWLHMRAGAADAIRLADAAFKDVPFISDRKPLVRAADVVLAVQPPGEFPVPLFDVAANCINIVGSFVGTRHDMAEALAFAVDGKVKADIELQPLSAINRVFERLQHGDVPSRVVLDFAGA